MGHFKLSCLEGLIMKSGREGGQDHICVVCRLSSSLPSTQCGFAAVALVSGDLEHSSVGAALL